MNRLLKLTVALAVSIGTTVAGGSLSASANDLNPFTNSSWQSAARQFWTQHQVSTSTQARLLTAYASSGFTDVEKGASPVKTASVNSGDFVETTETFADGSIRVARVQKPAVVSQDEVRPLSVNKCYVTTYSGVANYSNCLVESQSVGVNIGFFANFSLIAGVYNDQILDKGGNTGYQNCSLGTCTKPTFDSWKQKETSSGRAYLRFVSTYTGPGFTSTNHVRLLVGNNGYSSDGS